MGAAWQQRFTHTHPTLGLLIQPSPAPVPILAAPVCSDRPSRMPTPQAQSCTQVSRSPTYFWLQM